MRLLPVYQNNKVGFIDTQGHIVIEPRFDDLKNISMQDCFYSQNKQVDKWCFFNDDGFAVVMFNKKLGAIDETGKFVILPLFRDILCKLGNYWFTNNRGKICVLDQYSRCYPRRDLASISLNFREGLIGAELSDGRWTYLDADWQIAIPPQGFNDALWFQEGLAPVRIKDKWGFIDKTGKLVIPAEFGFLMGFSEGLAPVIIGKLEGYINNQGDVCIKPVFNATDIFHEGLAAVRLGSKWGYIDKDGRMVIDYQFDRADSFNDGLAIINIGHKYGFIDKTGKIVIQPRFDCPSDYGFTEGLCPVELDGKWGFIDKEDNLVIDCKFDEVANFEDGIAWVEVYGKQGYIDKSGNCIWYPTS